MNLRNPFRRRKKFHVTDHCERIPIIESKVDHILHQLINKETKYMLKIADLKEAVARNAEATKIMKAKHADELAKAKAAIEELKAKLLECEGTPEEIAELVAMVNADTAEELGETGGSMGGITE